MAITTINENDYIKDSRTVINNNFTELDTTKAPLNSPALTGTPTAPTPTPGDDSTKLATTAYVREELRQQYIDDRLATKLSLTGGTMLGAIKGSTLTLTAENGGNSASLVLGADGSATWNGKEVERVTSSSFSVNEGYIRFESGLQICYGYNTTESNRIGTVNFPVPFVAVPRIVGSVVGDTGAALTFLVRSDGTTVFTFLVNYGTESMQSVSANWVAVGYWK